MKELSKKQKTAIRRVFKDNHELVYKTKLGDIPNLINSMCKKAGVVYSIGLLIEEVQGFKAEEEV